jgi:hypothetical protein
VKEKSRFIYNFLSCHFLFNFKQFCIKQPYALEEKHKDILGRINYSSMMPWSKPNTGISYSLESYHIPNHSQTWE